MSRYFLRTLLMLCLSFLLGFSLSEHLYKKQIIKPQPESECNHERQAPAPEDDQTRVS